MSAAVCVCGVRAPACCGWGGRGVAYGLGSAAAVQEKTELAASLRSALAAATAKAASLEESVAALKLVLAAAWEWEWEWAALTLLVACLQVKDDVMAKLTAASRQLTHLKAGAGLDGHTHGDALVLENAELREALQRKDDRMREMLEYIVRTHTRSPHACATAGMHGIGLGFTRLLRDRARLCV